MNRHLKQSNTVQLDHDGVTSIGVENHENQTFIYMEGINTASRHKGATEIDWPNF